MSNPLLDELTQAAAADGVIDVFLDIDATRRGIGLEFEPLHEVYIRDALTDISLITGLKFNFVDFESDCELSFHRISDLQQWNLPDGAVGVATPSKKKTHNVVYFEDVWSEELQQAVIYHEIGHIFGLEHPEEQNFFVTTSDTIMSYYVDEFVGYTASDVLAFNEIWL